MKHPILLTLCVAATILNAQVIKRWPNGRIEMTDKKMAYEAHANIFEDYSWTYPDMKPVPVSFSGGKASFSLGGKTYQVATTGEKKMKLSGNGLETESEEQLTNGKMYYDKTALKLKAVTEQRWTSHTVMTQQSVMVQHSRQVTSYSYVNGRSVPQYRTEYYNTYEYRPVSKTEWRYVPYTHYVIDIPKYKYYQFALSNQLNVLIYKNEQGKYFVQNSAFVNGTDEEGINHILLDADGDGSFLGDADKVMFNSWNPYSSTSKYRSAGAYRDNKWYNIAELKHNNFLSFELDEAGKKLIIGYENAKYVDENDKGKVVFTNLPDDAELFVNGKEYKVRKEEAKFKSQYGKFLVRISQKGYTDFETVYNVTAEQPSVQVAYVPTEQAGIVKLSNIYEPSYSVNVSNDKGYSRTYNNEKSFNVPVGKNIISVYSNGFTLNYDADVNANGEVDIDFEKETKKLEAPDNHTTTEPGSTEQAKPH